MFELNSRLNYGDCRIVKLHSLPIKYYYDNNNHIFTAKLDLIR